jgi:hypothetical protein
MRAQIGAVDGFENFHEHPEDRELPLESDSLQVAVLLSAKPILVE